MANLLINTTVGGNAVITTSNIGSYALTSITSGNVTTALGFTPYNATNPSGYISSITSGNVTTALGYTPYNATNPSGYITSSALSSYVPRSGAELTEGNYFYFRSNKGAYLGVIDSPTLQVYATGGNAAFMSFHRGGNYAVNFGLDSDNIMRIGGWSASSNRWQLDMSGNNTIAGNYYGGGAGLTGTASSLNVGSLGGYSLDTMKKYIWSRGENLLTNGTGLMGNNTNFTSFTFDGSQAYFSSGSFKYTGQYHGPNTDELMPVNPEKRYRLDFWAKTLNGQGAYYAFLNFFDVDGNAIVAPYHMYYANTLTTLAQTLNPGDTVAYLTSAANWENGGTAGVSTHIRSFIFWNYSNSFGYLYPPQTYSRNWYPDAWNPGAINSGNNTITLRVPWSGPSIAAGTKVSNGSAGGTYKYIALGYTIVPTTWTNYVGIMDGVDYSGSNAGGQFPPGTAAAKLGFLTDYNASGDTIYLANLFVGVDNDYPIYDRWTGSTRIEKSGAFYGTIFYDSNNSGYYLDPHSTSNLYRVDAAAQMRAPIFYDSQDTNYYLDPNSTSRLVTVNADTLRSYGNVYTDGNYGHGLVGLYSASRYQGVFAMGDAYKLSADGTGTGTLYGIAWTHTNVGGQSKSGLGHQALFMDNGVTQTAIGSGIWTAGLITTTSYGTSANWKSAYDWGNHASVGYLTGITSGQVTGALGYTPYNSSNPSGYITSSGSISGNAGTVTNGVYTNSSAAISGDNHITFGPNSTWGCYLRVGGNGRTVSGDTYASMVTTNGNIHLDAGNSRAIYLNYYAGTSGTAFGNGATGVVAWMGSDGDLWKGSSDNSGTQYVYNSGTWSISINGNAATATTAGALSSMNISQFTNNSGYITGYTETDTLASVTGRGATTSTPITISTGSSQPLSLTTANSSPWHLALNRTDLGLTSRVFAHNSPYNGWYFEHNISIAGNTNWHSGNLTNLNQLSNGPGYLTSITSGNVTTALGYTPYNASNPAGYITSSGSISGNANTTSQKVFSDLKINFPSGAGGGYSFAANHYSMGLDSGNGGWDGPHYRDVIIGYHTGVRIGAHYSGIRFYNNSPTTDTNNDGNGDGGEALLMTIGGYVGTANHTDVVVNNNLIANVSLRAPIFYDTADTGYYGDFASTSVMNAIRFGTSTNSGTLSGNSEWGMRLTTNVGYIQFGPANGSYAHIYTDRDTFYFNRDLLVNGNTVLTAANYNSYSPTLTGGNASGTWSINVTGSAGSASTAGSATNLSGLGVIQSTSTGTSYSYNYQVRENSGGGSNTNEIYAPQLAFHWSGVVASSIMMEASGRMAIRNNPGTGYENFIAAVIYSSGYGDSTQWNTAYSWGNHASAGYQAASTAITTSNIGSQSVSYATTAGSAPNGSNSNQFYDVNAGVGNGLRFWNGSSAYKISMGVGALYQYGPVSDYSIKAQMNDTDPGRGFTWGRESYAPIAALNSTSGDMQIAGSLRAAGHLFTSYNGGNILLRSADNGGGAGILVQNSSGTFKFQIYGDAGNYGFLNGNWADWDIRKAVSGAMYMNNDSSYYLQTNSTSNFYALNIQGNAVVHAGNIGSQSVSYATSAQVLSSTNYIIQRGSNGSWNADFQATPAGSLSYGGDLGANGTNSPGGTWWMQQNFRHTNASNYWGTQVAWGWEDNANRLATRNITGGNYGAWVYYLNSSNFTTYAPSLTGSGASGTWGISVTGSAGSVAWTNVSSRPTALSQFTNDLGNYGGFLTSITAHTHAISDVTGLQTALDSKQASLGFTPYNSTNPSGYITSSGSISGNAATATIASTVTVNSGNSSAAWYPIVWHSGNTVYSSGVEIYAAGNYIRCQYINTTDNDESGITRFVIKNGDSYHRSATTTVAADIIRGAASGSWGINVTGSAGSVAWTNVSSRPTALSQFTNDLGNYGGWITGINSGNVTTALGFTPYNATNPSGYITSSASISGNAATATYATTAGSAPANGGNSATVGGYAPSGSVGANTVVIRDANNYIYAHYINSNVSETENPTINSFYTSNGDGWLRKSSVAHVKSQLGLGSMAYESSGTYQTVSGAINTGNIASQSVSYATISQQLTKFGDIYGQDWNTYYVNGKMIVSSVYGGSGPNFPTGAYNYGAMLSYGVTGSDFFQVYFPENGALQGGAFRKLHYRTGWNGSWSPWKSVVDQEGQVCTIAGSNQTGIEIHSNVGYNQNPLTYFLMRGQADSSWKTFKILLTGDAGGQDIEFRRIAENSTDARMFYVPRGLNQVIFDYTVVQPSDSRLKDNLTPITNPVDKIKSLRGVEFDWNSGEHVGTHDVGLIAQDVEAVLPEAVTTQEDGYKNLAYTKVIPLLVEAMKEQQAMIEALKAEIELLKNK